MIEIPEQGDDQHGLWADLIALAEAQKGSWTLIGAQMVALYAWDAGVESRPSEDADVLANVRMATNATREVTGFLRERGYEPEDSLTDVVHRFMRENAEIDVLAPDGLGPRSDITTIPGRHTIEVPGGSQALSRTELVSVRSREITGELPRPNLLGAILIKTRAIEVDDVPDAQRTDVALLLELVEDPDFLRADVRRSEQSWLRRHEYFADPDHPQWLQFEANDRERVALVYRRLVA
jgi:hypothetical protein